MVGNDEQVADDMLRAGVDASCRDAPEEACVVGVA